MLDALKFVRGAIARKDLVAALSHFRISGGRIKGYNGKIAICCPLPLDLDVMPKAEPFVKAISTCEQTVAMHVTPTGRLSIKSGPFRALVECLPDGEYPDIEPSGKRIKLDKEHPLLPALKLLDPFIADDASRPWARGILFRGQSAFATNNVVAVEHWLGIPFPVEVNVPKMAITELLRIGLEPVALQLDEHSITFHFSEGRWLWSNIYSTAWPEALQRVLATEATMQPLEPAFFAALNAIAPFVGKDGRVFLTPAGMTTMERDGEEAGATYEVEGIPAPCVYHLDHLSKLEGVAEQIGWDGYPGPAPFRGQRLRGAIIGMRS